MFHSLIHLNPLTVAQVAAAIAAALYPAVGVVQTVSTTGTIADFALNATTTILLLTSNATTTISGIAGGTDGRILDVYYEGNGSTITFLHNNGGSASANRIFTPASASWVNNTARWGYRFIYNATSQAWTLMGSTRIPALTIDGILAVATVNVSGTLTANSSLFANAQTVFAGVASPAALTTAASPYIDYAVPSASTNYWRLDPTTPAVIGGLGSPSNGRVILIHNIATAFANTITFTHEDATSAAANRWQLPNNTSFVLAAGASVWVQYIITTGKWRVIGSNSKWSPMAHLLNANAGAVVVGAPVYAQASGSFDKARANAVGTSLVAGLVDHAASIAIAGTGPIRSVGPITLTTTEWDAVTGETGGLTFNARYFLDPATAGKLTRTAPVTAGQLVCPVGLALSTTTMLVRIGETVLL